MKALFIGSVKFSEEMMSVLLLKKGIELCGIVTKEKSTFNADFVNVRSITPEHVPYFYFQNNTEEMIKWIKNLNPDVIFCLGWSHLLPEEVIKLPPLGVLGYHPADLPKNRGRHPLIWSIVLGLSEIASTFFMIADGADTGDIISKAYLPLGLDDDASTIYDKLVAIGKNQFSKILDELIEKGRFFGVPQNDEESSTWRKRGPKDGEIDWRMGKMAIYNLVRGLTRPYVGAHCYYEGLEIKVWKVRFLDFSELNIEPGKVVKVEGKSIFVKCYDGMIEIIDHEFSKIPQIGEYLL
ncbi:MAG: methionyl-tRNA formyltransferase [Bacteriovoracaceae bacterium]